MNRYCSNCGNLVDEQVRCAFCNSEVCKNCIKPDHTEGDKIGAWCGCEYEEEEED